MRSSLTSTLRSKSPPDRCPKLTATPGFDWRENAHLEIMHNWNIGVADMLTPKLTEQLNSMRDKLVANIDCNTARAEVAKLWAPRSIPVAIPNNGQVFVNVEPESIGFSGVQSTDTALDLALMISAKVSVDTSAETMAAKPLPALSRIPLAAGKIVIAVPLRASYVSLNQAIANAVKGKVHSTATPAGPVQVTIRDVEVYPSNGRLAVSISFSAQLPGHWLDTNGTVYLAGKPETEGNAQIIAITDLQFGRNRGQ